MTAQIASTVVCLLANARRDILLGDQAVFFFDGSPMPRDEYIGLLQGTIEELLEEVRSKM